jgi:hypothetical protein
MIMQIAEVHSSSTSNSISLFYQIGMSLSERFIESTCIANEKYILS